MSARDQEFAVAEVIEVTRGVSILSFPAFPHGGTLIVLQPPCAVTERELTGYAAEINTPSGQMHLRYDHWHMNDDRVIGLLIKKPQKPIPLRSKVRFVKR